MTGEMLVKNFISFTGCEKCQKQISELAMLWTEVKPCIRLSSSVISLGAIMVT